MTAIDRDTRCVTCGYNLRGLNTAGLCPECGSAYVPPVPLPTLIDDAAWRQRLLTGATISVWSTVALIAALIVAVCVVAASPDQSGPLRLGAAMAIPLPFMIAATIGSHLLTAPEPFSPWSMHTWFARAGGVGLVLTWSVITCLIVLDRFTSPEIAILFSIPFAAFFAVQWLLGSSVILADLTSRARQVRRQSDSAIALTHGLCWVLGGCGFGPVILLIHHAILAAQLRRALRSLLQEPIA